jgi:hypothetical protein
MRFCTGETFLSSASRISPVVLPLPLVMIDQRSEPKKPLPGEFLHEKIKFPRSGENR